jgi:4-hydroxy-tetrahydrodipicolinate synthase
MKTTFRYSRIIESEREGISMAEAQIQGVVAASLTPRHGEGTVDVAAMRRLIEFLMHQGIFQYAVNGATGEFCLTTPEQLRTMLSIIRSVAGERATTLCGVGAASIAQTLALAHAAEDEGAAALLLPMPYFFSYQQDDLEAFCRAVANDVKLPILLYNLPQFTTGLHEETVCRLIRDVDNIIGIKDSSGSLDILRSLTQQNMGALRIVGHDGVFAQALAEGVCDGVISGIGGVFPELIQSLYAHKGNCISSEFRAADELIKEVIVQLDRFPTPWALKWIAQARGIMQPSFALPISLRRAQESQHFMELFPQWQARMPPPFQPRIAAALENPYPNLRIPKGDFHE